MLQHFLRLFLVLAMLAAGMSAAEEGQLFANSRTVLVVGSFFLAIIVVTVEILIPRKSLQALAGVFFGLSVGLLVAYVLNFVLDLLVATFLPMNMRNAENFGAAIAATKFMLGIISCYYCISFVLQTKDDIRFVIPYVEFAKQIKGERPILLDTSVIIDGRIEQICDTGIIDQPLIVPRFVLQELQTVADSSDKLKRVRGRRGLDILNSLQASTRVEVQIHEPELSKDEHGEPVDSKLLTLAQKLNGRVATNDYNLNKLGKVRGIDIININDLANALKPVALPGEALTVKIIKPGEEGGQGVGYLDDGTMVVVDNGRDYIGQIVEIAVTSMLQTSAGRMIFGRIDGGQGGSPAPRGNRRRPDSR